MSGDEGEGGGIGKKEGWNKEEECMINRNSESEFWRNREDHGEMGEWKIEKYENDGMEGGWNEDDVG